MTSPRLPDPRPGGCTSRHDDGLAQDAVRTRLRALMVGNEPLVLAGFRREEILVGDDGRSLVVAVFLDSKEDYQRLAEDPEQDTWWSGQMSPLVSDVHWTDGSWQEPIAVG